MTYQEIQNRLSKCELALNQIKNGTLSNSNHPELEKTKEKLEVLRESYRELLKEAEDMGDDGFVATDDEDKAADLAKDGVKVKLTNEQEGVEFSEKETRLVAKKVGEALIKALREVGDEIDQVKARKIEPNSFEVYIKYKNDFEDEFSFYIDEDRLVLADFSFQKELGEIGVKPSGEPIVHVEVIKNNLVKHFKSLNESDDIRDIEVQADEYEEYEKLKKGLNNKEQVYRVSFWHTTRFGKNDHDVPVKATSEEEAIEKVKKEFPTGRHFEVFKIDGEVLDPWNLIESSDSNGSGLNVIPKDQVQANKLNDLIEDSELYAEWNEIEGYFFFPESEENYDILEQQIQNLLDTNNIQATIEGIFEQAVKEDLDVGHRDDEPDMLKQHAYDIATYAAKLYKQLNKYDQMDTEVDFPNWWQSKVILARDYISKAQHYLEFEEKQPALDQLALQESVNEDFNPTIAAGSTYAIQVEDLGSKIALTQDNGQTVVIHKEDIDSVVEALKNSL